MAVKTEELQPRRDAASRALFPQGLAGLEQASLSEVLRLYETMVQSSESLVQRRLAVNSFYVSLNALFVAGCGAVLSLGEGVATTPRAATLLILACAGALISYSWRSLIVSFGQLNAGKFTVIGLLEERLPAAVYTAEWEALGRGGDRKRYTRFTKREAWTPWSFLGLYVAGAVAALLVLILA